MPNQRVSKSQSHKKASKRPTKKGRSAKPQEVEVEVESFELNSDLAEGSREEVDKALEHDKENQIEQTDNKTIH